MSFLELFQDLEKYIDNPERRWNECLRVKRGLVDTSVPGAFCKDQCYLEGALAILIQRDEIQDFKVLHCGRITLSDLTRVNRVVKPNVCTPHFLVDDAQYRARLQEIIKVNQIPINELELPKRESLLLKPPGS